MPLGLFWLYHYAPLNTLSVNVKNPIFNRMLRKFSRILIFIFSMVLGNIFAQSPIDTPIQISAHRGNSMHAPENTLATFRKVLAMGVDFIEIDVRTSSDGALLILHGGNLERTTDGQGPIKNLS